MSNLLSQMCTVENLTDGAPDGDGNFVRTVATVTESCRMQQLGTSEPPAGANVLARWKWYGEASSTITAASRVVVNGVRYRVDGQPHYVWGSYAPSHVQAYLSLAVDVEDPA